MAWLAAFARLLLSIPMTVNAQAQLSIVSAASYEGGMLAPEAMASAFGARLAEGVYRNAVRVACDAGLVQVEGIDIAIPTDRLIPRHSS